MTEFNRKKEKHWKNFAEFFNRLKTAPQNEYRSQEALQEEDESQEAAGKCIYYYFTALV